MKPAQTSENEAPKLAPSRRVVGYFRFPATFDQTERLIAVSNHESRICEAAGHLDLSMVECFHDELPTPEMTDRPGYVMAMNLVAGGIVDTFICPSVTMLSRFHTEIAAHLSYCLKHGVRVIFIDDELDSAVALGRLLSLNYADLGTTHEAVAINKWLSSRNRRLRAA